MCMFEFPNRCSPQALLKGMEKFECGHCPECLQKKSRLWALRAGMEMRDNCGMMITLTYDTYAVDKYGQFTNIENPIDPTIPLSKRHCQLFIKRLRKRFIGKTIKYIIAAERGKKGRAHYHALIFGLVFDDLIRYKKSKRGNIIYKSKTLTDIWQHGICTVDSINPTAKIARYCTKYCAKDSGADETFMLFSRGIGEKALLREFNGKSYWVDGREYSIPRQIWNKVIEKRYFMEGYSKYVNKVHLEDVERLLVHKIERYEKRFEKIRLGYISSHNKIGKRLLNHYKRERKWRKDSTRIAWEDKGHKIALQLAEKAKKIGIQPDMYPLSLLKRNAYFYAARKLAARDVIYENSKRNREKFFLFRDNDTQYQEYLEYWHRKAVVNEISRPSVELRILALPDNKYRSYKNKAVQAKQRQFKRLDFVPPRSNCTAFLRFKDKKVYEEKPFAPLSRHYGANDTTVKEVNAFLKQRSRILREDMEKNPIFEKRCVLLDDPFAKVRNPVLIDFLSRCKMRFEILQASRLE